MGMTPRQIFPQNQEKIAGVNYQIKVKTIDTIIYLKIPAGKIESAN